MIRMFSRLSIFAISLSLMSAGLAHADKFRGLPTLDGKASKTLQARFVHYDGSTNGAMIIDVKNTGKTAAAFTTEGLYFVPDGDPEKAPQRLGAGGPFVEIAKDSKSGANLTGHKNKLVIPPGQTRRLALEVFCIDSHRPSPSSDTKFSLANKRLPKKLRRDITVGNQSILRQNKGDVARSKSAIQSNMWETRDRDWVKLEGERKDEKAAKTHIQMQMGNQRVRREMRNVPRQMRNNVEIQEQQ